MNYSLMGYGVQQRDCYRSIFIYNPTIMAIEGGLSALDEQFFREVTQVLPDPAVVEAERYDGMSKGAKDAQLMYAVSFFQSTLRNKDDMNAERIGTNALRIVNAFESWRQEELSQTALESDVEALSGMNLYSLRRIARLNIGYFYNALHHPDGKGFMKNLELWHHCFSASSVAIEFFEEQLRLELD